MIHIGCCGFPVARQKYYDAFRVVELQQTFYQLPRLNTVRKWRVDAPDGFEYTLKAWQLITHEPISPTYRKLGKHIPLSIRKNYGSFKPTDEVFEAWEKTKEVADILKARIIVFQCPPSFEPTNENITNLKNFFLSIGSEKYIFVWEPRGKWNEQQIKSICQELDLVHCVDPFKAISTHGKILYYRLHGISGYRYKYTQEDMNRLITFLQKKTESYIMFNNVYMYEDALALKTKIMGNGIFSVK